MHPSQGSQGSPAPHPSMYPPPQPQHRGAMMPGHGPPPMHPMAAPGGPSQQQPHPNMQGQQHQMPPQQMQQQQMPQQQMPQQQMQQQQMPQQQMQQQQVQQQQHAGPPGQPSIHVVPAPVQQQPYHLTQAQLSPAPVQEKVPPPPPSSSTSAADQANRLLPKKLQALFKGETTNEDGRKLGFTVTQKLVSQHEKNQQERMALLSTSDDDNTNQPVRPLYQFQVTKLRSWRTGYVRLLCLYENYFSTTDPVHTDRPAAETNRWDYAALTDWLALPKEKETILLQVANDKLKFSCHEVPRAIVLTALLTCRYNHYCATHPPKPASLLMSVSRQRRHGTQVDSALDIQPHGLVEVNPSTNKVLQTYRYMDVRTVSFTSDNPSGVILHFAAPFKTRLFFVRGGKGRSDLVTALQDFGNALGLAFQMTESMTAQDWLTRRRSADTGAVATMWPVSKTSRRHDVAFAGIRAGETWVGGMVRRQLALTGEGFMVELDGAGMVSCRMLSHLVAVVRHVSPADQVTLEFVDGTARSYSSPNRDALIVSLLDAAATLGKNARVHLTDVPSHGYCLTASTATVSDIVLDPEGASSGSGGGGLFQPISIPVYTLKRVYSAATQAFAYVSHDFEHFRTGQTVNLIQECEGLVEACREFNASVTPTGEGLPSGQTDKTVSGSLGALWGLVGGLLGLSTAHADPATQNSRDRYMAEQTSATLFQTLCRLSSTIPGYGASAELTTLQETIPLLFTIDDVFCKYWAFQVLNILLSGLPNKRDMETEYVNKNVILKCGGDKLIEGFVSALLEPSKSSQTLDSRYSVSDLVLMVTSDVLQSILCSYHDTTNPMHFQALIEALGNRYGALLSTLRSQTPFVIENTALLLHLLSRHSPQTSAAIRDAALSSAILLQHFYTAIFSPLEGKRFLSRYLCSLWLSGSMDCSEKRLLKRMVPHGFLAYLNMPALSKMEEEQLDALERDAVETNISDPYSEESSGTAAIDVAKMQQGAAGTNTARLRSRIVLATATASKVSQEKPENFRIFFHVLTQDHSLADLIWSQQTRRELRIGLESELELIRRETEARGLNAIAWNHQQFRVKYPSLENEVKVGSIYMRLWLEAGDGFIKSWEEPLRLFEHLFRRFLCEIDRNEKVTIMCIRCLERLYAIHAHAIGPFPDVMVIVQSMATTKSTETQHRLLGLLATVLGVPRQHEDEATADIPDNAEQLLNERSIGQLCQFVAWGHTNETVMENVLTRVLATTATMITDGTDGCPEANGPAAPVTVGDSTCPAVWFVASTSKVPPPPEAIRGPYRLSDLRRMMEGGDLTPFDLITTSHVEEYDVDPESTTVQDSHVDKGKWRRLNKVWQLRWQLCSDGSSSAIYQPSDVALIALRSLTRLVDIHRSHDSRGLPYFPIPTAKRILSSTTRDRSSTSEQSDSLATPLSILSQALLCNDSRLVDHASGLLYKLTLQNDQALAKLYLTGVFYFAFSYTGSNFKGIARLFEAVHLKQHFRSGFAAAADEKELPMKERSILGHMLPEGLLFILVNYGAERFAKVFVGNADTPEVIWTLDMRRHLIEMIRQHLGDFPLRLYQNNTTEYEYCPMPGVAYKRLEKELFCHNYYLENLCNEERFPNWPIAEPVEVFRACLEKFKNHVERDERSEEEALEKARHVLNLNDGDGTKELRKAYRNLARKFHPDKNPAGRETFEAIQSSYELLLPLVERGEKIRVFASVDLSDDGTETDGIFGPGSAQMKTMELLIRTQLLICRRYQKQMSRYKYPAYRILLTCLALPSNCQYMNDVDISALLATPYLQADRAEFTRLAVELLFRTCLVSPLNSEELVAESGVPVLAALLDFYVVVARNMEALKQKSGVENHSSVISEDVVADILGTTVHTLAGMAFFETGRNSLKEVGQQSRLLLNWRRCVDGSLFKARDGKQLDAPIKRFALEGVTNMSKDSLLQTKLVGAGVLWPLLRLSLQYDPTLEAASTGGMDQDDIDLSVGASNVAARLSVRALGMLSGALEDAPKNESVASAMDILLTKPLARMLGIRRTGEILRALNTNVEQPDLIWDTSMRNQLETLLLKIEAERPENDVREVEEELLPTSGFSFEALKRELQIGGVYVRVFNNIGRDALSCVQRPGVFADDLVAFVARSLNGSKQVKDWKPISIEELQDGPKAELNESFFLLVMRALQTVCRVDGLLTESIQLTSTVPSVLLSLLELPVDSEAFDIGSDILSTLSPQQPFADAVCRSGALWRLVAVLARAEPHEESSEPAKDSTDSQALSQRKVRGWSVLEALSSSPSIAVQILASSVWIELLGVMVGFKSFTKVYAARLGAAKTLSRLLWDPAVGLQTVSLLERFLPSTLIARIKEDANATLGEFDSDADTPELIWDSSMRAELRRVLAAEIEDCLRRRENNPSDSMVFTLRPEVRVRYSKLERELYIGGVYVSRFLKEPTFNLRDPTTFLELLLERWTKELEMFTSPDPASNSTSSSSALIEDASQDVLELVTTASVYLCKVRESLCDKFAQWGYLPRTIAFLHQVLEKQLVGAPLLAVVRLLHVAVDRMVNVEGLAVIGDGKGKKGVVEGIIWSIGGDPLHTDCAFMVELLKKIYTTALGDVKKARSMAYPTRPGPQMGFVGMAPSPAPGEGPVRKRVSAEDDPLAMLGMSPSPMSGPPVAHPFSQGQGQTREENPQVGYGPSTTAGLGQGYQASGHGARTTQGPGNLGSSVASLGSTTSSLTFDSTIGGVGRSQAFHQASAPQRAYPQNDSAGHPFNQPGRFSQPQQRPPQPRAHTPQYQQPHSTQRRQDQQPLNRQAAQPYSQQQQSQFQQQNQQRHFQQQPQRQQYQQQQSQFQQQPQRQQYQQQQSQYQQQPQRQQYQQQQSQYQQAPNQYQQSQPIQHQPQQYTPTQNSFLARSQQLNQQTSPPGHLQTTQVVDQQQQPQAYARTSFPSQPHREYQQPGQHQQEQPQEVPLYPQMQQQQQQAQPSRYQQPQGARLQPPGPPYQNSHQQGLSAENFEPSQYQQGVPGQQHHYSQQQQQQMGQSQEQLAPHRPTSAPPSGAPPPPPPHMDPSGYYQPQLPNGEMSQSGISPQVPVVETVPPEQYEAPQYAPTAIEGSGIDARTHEDPVMEAEQRAQSTGGAPGAAAGRVALLEQALATGLVEFLIDSVLENPSLPSVRDPAAAKVHCIDLCKLLTKDPGFGPKFKLILDELPAWAKYKSQDHSLLITGHEQRADYFLTDGGSSSNKFLTQG